ncbi:MAG: hypothetical protein KJZ85_11625 [Rhodobacteraceae bacterium]|jgi:hypothetical protein|nr:hypothetical protein [Paracoccaceae bacterium]
MVRKDGTLVDRLIHRRSLRRWERVASEAAVLDPPSLRALRGEARELRARLDQALHAAEGRIALPGGGTAEIELPLHYDWAWRPGLWRAPLAAPGHVSCASGTALGPDVKLFHDCAAPEFVLRQVRNGGAADQAPFGVSVEVFALDGTFLSIVIDLPEAAARSLRLRHVLGLTLETTVERPAEVLARLNIRHGPNTEQIARSLPLGQGSAVAEFDLAYSKVNEKRVEAAWIDLILGGVPMNRILIRDAVLTRRPRAEL